MSALRYLWRGAEAGFGRCLATLAELYADGAPEIGIQPDPVRERRLSLLCAQLGRFDCQLRLARMFAHLAEDRAQDRRLYLDLAFTWLQVARDNPHNDDHAAVWTLASKVMHARAVPRGRPSQSREPFLQYQVAVREFLPSGLNMSLTDEVVAGSFARRPETVLGKPR